MSVLSLSLPCLALACGVAGACAFTVQLVAAQDYSTAVGGLDLNTVPPDGVDPYGAATGEAGDAVSAMLAVTSGAGGGGGSAAMDKKQAFQKVRIWLSS